MMPLRHFGTLALLVVVAAQDCDKDVAEGATTLLQQQLSVNHLAVHPWDKHIFLVGTHHKSGSQLLRNTMAHVFDIVGATMSCQYSGHGESITSLNRENDCNDFPAPLRFHNHLNKEDFLHLRQEAEAMKSDVRGVMITRDPLEMVASAYVYHHRSSEPGNSIEFGIPLMGPEEGVPEMAKRMRHVVQQMAEVYEVRGSDLLAVRYENMTESSQGFDDAVENILNTLFKDDITDFQRKVIKEVTRVEDLNRGTGRGMSPTDADNPFTHTNDEEDMETARKALKLIPADLYAEYEKFQKMLGYGKIAYGS